jgi:hypothetical protein
LCVYVWTDSEVFDLLAWHFLRVYNLYNIGEKIWDHKCHKLKANFIYMFIKSFWKFYIFFLLFVLIREPAYYLVLKSHEQFFSFFVKFHLLSKLPRQTVFLYTSKRIKPRFFKSSLIKLRFVNIIFNTKQHGNAFCLDHFFSSFYLLVSRQSFILYLYNYIKTLLYYCIPWKKKI